jgi:hypothetical protein
MARRVATCHRGGACPDDRPCPTLPPASPSLTARCTIRWWTSPRRCGGAGRGLRREWRAKGRAGRAHARSRGALPASGRAGRREGAGRHPVAPSPAPRLARAVAAPQVLAVMDEAVRELAVRELDWEPELSRQEALELCTLVVSAARRGEGGRRRPRPRKTEAHADRTASRGVESAKPVRETGRWVAAWAVSRRPPRTPRALPNAALRSLVPQRLTAASVCACLMRFTALSSPLLVLHTTTLPYEPSAMLLTKR